VTYPSFSEFLKKHGLGPDEKIGFAAGVYLIIGERNRKRSRARKKFEELITAMRLDQMPDDGIPPIDLSRSFSIWKNLSEMEIDGFNVKDVFNLHKVAIRKNISVQAKKIA